MTDRQRPHPLISGSRLAVPARARRATLAIVVALAFVLALHLTIGLGDVLLYGLVGGLAGALIVVGLDLLRNAQSAIEATMPTPRDIDAAGEVRR